MDTQGDERTVRLLPTVSVGQRFADRYGVERLLGRGGMGSVYCVRDHELDELVALKLLETASPELVVRFRREVRLARRVTHRNAARTYDLGEHRGLRFLTMEFVDGESLRERCKRSRPGLTSTLDIVRQIADGLAAAHAAGVVHRDLKPANVLLERGGRVVITDFGIARAVQVGDASLQSRGALGTPAYMAPEQLASERVGPAADAYALGLILHELLTGSLPYASANLMDTAIARLGSSPPDLASSHGVDPRLAQMVAQLLARTPAQRPALTTVARAMLEIMESLELDALSMVTSRAAPAQPLTLAVLPFTYRGAEEDRYLAEALADELVDLLAMTEGLRVSGGGVTAKFAEHSARDLQAIGRQLGVDVLVDGTVEVAAEQLAVVAQLLDAQTGAERWTERFEGSRGDVFELQDRLAKRIAEALRLAVEPSIHRGDASPEAIEHYLRARQLTRAWRLKGEHGAIAHYQRCLALAPGFKLALASYAHAAVRAWYVPRSADEPDWRELAERAVTAALAGAPELAETQLAAARWAAYLGEFPQAVRALRQALAIAPTYAEALYFFGLLQLESGRASEGLERIELALELDAGLLWALSTVARYHALRGDIAEYDRWIARFFAADTRPTEIPVHMLQARVGGWIGDRERSATAAAAIGRSLGKAAALAKLAALYASEPVSEATLTELFERLLPSVPNPYFRATMLQIGCELAVLHGHEQLAVTWLEQLDAAAFADLDWLEHCVVLEPIRSRAIHRRCVASTRARAEAIGWR
ncbi:MAG TPA: protein kinase [Enhygromyxa sp.]|nr:protein kinase [Enhygromyxa sp.]